jgi:hypothetical protein
MGRGWEKYPDLEQTEIIRTKCKAAGMKPGAIDLDPFEAFIRGEYTSLEDDGPHSIGEWLYQQKGDDTRAGRRPHLFVDFTGGQFELEREGFLYGNMTARAKLVNMIGESDANARAVDWNLNGVSDFTKGKAKEPDAALLALNDQKRKLENNIARDTAALATINKAAPEKDASVSSATNPFGKAAWNVSAQGRLVKNLGEDKARAIARSVGVDLGATRPNPNF